ncbi:ABC transporter ATP-binding protein [Sphingobium sp. SYK-6]|uniref:ABC transporter ATP-binding protein n=1 Tax=Sphingobium sp. (strain NBRC 103272 / SYK-6) TaxID=627192 RepID=UPI0002277499|nr:ABC transporter ATP-binding protein [Sphingobium sp. SYK-6]BAK67739.1 ABC transporter ATP-binding protein [Sphingobium sp. SYK-6]
MLAAQGVHVKAGDAVLLDSIYLSLAPGRVTAIIGPNGAGKSTLLACLAGLLPPARGYVLLDEAPLAGRAAKVRARDIGYLPQDPPLHWNVSVRALASLGRVPHGDAQSEAGQRAIATALEETGMTGFADRLAGTLSGGERSRAMLARVLAGEPRWLLADEPFAALDIAHRQALMMQLRRIAARGIGVVVVVHDLALAAQLADEVVLLDRGRLAAAGPTKTVMTPQALETVFGVAFAYARLDEGEVLVSCPRV